MADDAKKPFPVPGGSGEYSFDRETNAHVRATTPVGKGLNLTVVGQIRQSYAGEWTWGTPKARFYADDGTEVSEDTCRSSAFRLLDLKTARDAVRYAWRAFVSSNPAALAEPYRDSLRRRIRRLEWRKFGAQAEVDQCAVAIDLLHRAIDQEDPWAFLHALDEAEDRARERRSLDGDQ